MKQTNSNKVPVGIANFKNEAAILIDTYNVDRFRFTGKTYSVDAKANELTTGHKHKEDMIMLDIFGALNY